MRRPPQRGAKPTRRRDEGNPNFSEGNPRPRGSNSKSGGRKSKLNPCISFVELSLIKELRRPPRRFSFLRPFRPQTRRGSAGVARAPRIVSRSFCLRFSSSGLMKQVKGWRHFDRERLDAVSADLAAVSLCAKKGILGPRARGPGKRQGDRSDVRQEYVRLKRARSGLEPLPSGRAPALHACECLTMPAFESYPFSSPREAEAAAFCRTR